MKQQGRADSNRDAGAKREPIAHAVSVVKVADIGIQHHHTVDSRPLYEGRGLEAPMQGSTIHHCGSQGKHK